MLKNVTKDETVQYVLAMVEEMLAGAGWEGVEWVGGNDLPPAALLRCGCVCADMHAAPPLHAQPALAESV